jgi:hypothetical protein
MRKDECRLADTLVKGIADHPVVPEDETVHRICVNERHVKRLEEV